mgnify:CR=1 FL=1
MSLDIVERIVQCEPNAKPFVLMLDPFLGKHTPKFVNQVTLKEIPQIWLCSFGLELECYHSILRSEEAAKAYFKDKKARIRVGRYPDDAVVNAIKNFRDRMGRALDIKSTFKGVKL